VANAPQDQQPQEHYDVAILGGGLAGLSLALQLKRARPDTGVFVAERRKGPAPEAAFKVGESSLEIGAHYLARVVGLKDHIEADQLPKMGVRFFFPAGDNSDIAKRSEYGPPGRPKLPTYQFDRGRLENELARRNHDAGVDLFDGCVAEGLELSDDGHTVQVARDGASHTMTARWVVDASGRASFLKRRFGLEKDAPHDINSSWFRLSERLDLEDWSDDPAFHARMSERGLRWLSTNHLLDKGYWVWLIPLSSGSTSIGIVADPRIHPSERIDTMEAAFEWLGEHEPQLAGVLEERREKVVDFLKVHHYSHGAERVFSPERWCLTGDAGAFLDPLFSPGSDFIGTSNSLITSLILADLEGELPAERVEFANDFYLRYFEAWLAHYQDLYPLFDNVLITTVRFGWYASVYFGIFVPLFYENRTSDLDFLADVKEDLDRVLRLIPRVTSLVNDWGALENPDLPPLHVRPITPAAGGLHDEFLSASQDESTPRSNAAAVKAHIAKNLKMLEASAVVYFDEAVGQLGGQSLDPSAKINPYAVSLHPERWDEDGVFDGTGLTVAEADAAAAGLRDALEALRFGRVPSGPPPRAVPTT
jgi:flavin-dependent dehydrogenase